MATTANDKKGNRSTDKGLRKGNKSAISGSDSSTEGSQDTGEGAKRSKRKSVSSPMGGNYGSEKK